MCKILRERANCIPNRIVPHHKPVNGMGQDCWKADGIIQVCITRKITSCRKVSVKKHGQDKCHYLGQGIDELVCSWIVFPRINERMLLNSSFGHDTKRLKIWADCSLPRGCWYSIVAASSVVWDTALVSSCSELALALVLKMAIIAASGYSLICKSVESIFVCICSCHQQYTALTKGQFNCGNGLIFMFTLKRTCQIEKASNVLLTHLSLIWYRGLFDELSAFWGIIQNLLVQNVPLVPMFIPKRLIL